MYERHKIVENAEFDVHNVDLEQDSKEKEDAELIERNDLENLVELFTRFRLDFGTNLVRFQYDPIAYL